MDPNEPKWQFVLKSTLIVWIALMVMYALGRTVPILLTSRQPLDVKWSESLPLAAGLFAGAFVLSLFLWKDKQKRIKKD